MRHVQEIVAEYEAQPFDANEPLILISISKSYDDEARGSIYNAVRGCWKINPKKAKDFRLLLAHRHGLVLGAFRPKEWLKAIPANFPWLSEELEGRWGFTGEEAESEVKKLYLGKRVPDVYRAKGAANPVRFIEAAAPQTH